MYIEMRATIKDTTGQSPTLHLALVKVESNVHRWITEPEGAPFDGVDHLSAHDAVKQLRVTIETEPKWASVDLTFMPVEPPAEVRAAGAIGDAVAKMTGGWPREWDTDRIADIIRTETQIDKIVAGLNELLAYLIQRIGNSDPVLAGLEVPLIEALEKCQKSNYDNVKRRLKPQVENMVIVPNIPSGKKELN
jgi:hypothetical protein